MSFWGSWLEKIKKWWNAGGKEKVIETGKEIAEEIKETDKDKE